MLLEFGHTPAGEINQADLNAPKHCAPGSEFDLRTYNLAATWLRPFNSESTNQEKVCGSRFVLQTPPTETPLLLVLQTL